MRARGKHYGPLKRTGRGTTLQCRLTLSIVTVILVVLGTGMLLDLHLAREQLINTTIGSLEEQARAIRTARLQITDPAQYARYVDNFCAQMNIYISPGHHILVLDETGEVSTRSRHHSGAEVEQALLAGSPQDRILTVGQHRLAQVRVRDKRGGTIIVAQYLDHMERILRWQLMSLVLTAAATALAIILLIYLIMKVWVIAPVNGLVAAARQWAARDFSARSESIGPADFRLLADEFNIMSEQLERHERTRRAELEQARTIQANLLPTAQPTAPALRIATEYRPAEHIGGDLYDVFDLPHDRICIAILDVCGHGISAALLTGVVKMSLHRRLAEEGSLRAAVRGVNRDLLACTPEGHFVTACVGIWNPQERSWTYCAAGHPGGLLLTPHGTESLESTAPLLGALEETHWPANTIKLSPGDRVFLYTDGVVESGLAEENLGDYDLEGLVGRSADSGVTEQVAAIMAETIRRSGGEMKDDATIVAFEVAPEPAL